jgi:hypothetical protein
MNDGKKFIITSIITSSIDKALEMLKGVHVDVTDLSSQQFIFEIQVAIPLYCVV